MLCMMNVADKHTSNRLLTGDGERICKWHGSLLAVTKLARMHLWRDVQSVSSLGETTLATRSRKSGTRLCLDLRAGRTGSPPEVELDPEKGRTALLERRRGSGFASRSAGGTLNPSSSWRTWRAAWARAIYHKAPRRRWSGVGIRDVAWQVTWQLWSKSVMAF